jgi:hypothetical protein
VKRLAICLATMLLLLSITMSAQAGENNYKGEFISLLGNKSIVQGSYQLTDKLRLNGDLEELSSDLENFKYQSQKDYFLRTDLHYQIANWLGIKIGGRYDSAPGETIPYGGLDFLIPFGDNDLKFTGFYDYNYQGKDQTSYETALRIQMYEHFYIDAGVRGDGGSGFTRPYIYNKENDPLFFIRGNYTKQWGKFNIELRPLVFVIGEVMYDTNFKYNLNDRTNIVLSVGDYYDRETKYRLGFQYKF